jgi:hypothetical protein
MITIECVKHFSYISLYVVGKQFRSRSASLDVPSDYNLHCLIFGQKVTKC